MATANKEEMLSNWKFVALAAMFFLLAFSIEILDRTVQFGPGNELRKSSPGLILNSSQKISPRVWSDRNHR